MSEEEPIPVRHEISLSSGKSIVCLKSDGPEDLDYLLHRAMSTLLILEEENLRSHYIENVKKINKWEKKP